MSLSTKEYLNNDPDRILFHKLLYELKSWFLVCLPGNSFFSDLVVTDFSSQLNFILAKIKIKNWDFYVCDVIIVQHTS